MDQEGRPRTACNPELRPSKRKHEKKQYRERRWVGTKEEKKRKRCRHLGNLQNSRGNKKGKGTPKKEKIIVRSSEKKLARR